MFTSDLFIENKLPDILSKEELSEYFIKYRLGDYTARDKIIMCNIKLVLNEIFRKFFNSTYDKQELLSVGIIGLIKSVDTFDITKNYQFSTYALRCIDNEIAMFLNKEKKRDNDVSIEICLGNNKDTEGIKIKYLLEDISINIEKEFEKSELNKAISNIIETLPEDEKELIKAYYGFKTGEKINQFELAKRLNVSQKVISVKLKKARQKIASELTKQQLIKNDYKKSHDNYNQEIEVPSSIDKEEYIKILNLLKSSTFRNLSINMSIKEAIINAIRLNSNDSNPSLKSIATYLGIQYDEVLVIYSENNEIKKG